MKKEAKKRTIYNNYDLQGEYEENARECCVENGIKNPTENDIWDKIYLFDEDAWEIEKENLKDFFSKGMWILRGTEGRWNGTFEAGTVFTDFMDMFSKAVKDCNYVHIYDENGHLYLQCSHHDGINNFEIKKITDKGVMYLENWEENLNDKRTEQQIHDKIMKRYSTLPHFAHIVYGCPKIEYENAK